MSDLPTGWLRVKVGEIAHSVQSGFASGDHNRDGIGIVHLRPMNIGRDGRLILEDVRYVKDADGHRLRRGDVLFNNTNSAELVGKTTWIDIDGELAFSNHMTRVRLSEEVSPEFIARQLHHLWSRGVFELLCNNHVSQASVSARSLSAEVELALPPATEQKRIVARIEELTTRSRRAKQALDAVPALLAQLRQSILAAAFRGDLTADWRANNPNVEPADKLIARIRTERRVRWEAAEAALGRTRSKYHEATETVPEEAQSELPYGWAWVTAEECAWDITVGHVGPMKHRYVAKGVPFLRSQNVRENRFDREGLLYIPDDFHADLRKSSLRPGDLVVVRSGAPGTACVVPDELPDANCADLVICRLVPSILADLLCHFVNSQHAKTQVLDAQVGVAQQHFNIGSMRKLIVPLMPIEEQHELLGRLAAAFASLADIDAAVEAAHDRCSVLDASILAKAFRGMIVPQDANDEPASVLLERVRAARDSSTAEAGSRRRSHQMEQVAEEPDESDDNGLNDVPAPSRQSAPDRRATKNIREFDQDAVHDEVFAALWPAGPLDKDAAVRRVAEHFRKAGYVEFQRLRSDGPQYAQFLEFIEAAVKAGRLDRPKRGQVRACKADATTFTADDWRLALVASLGAEPTDRDDAIRVAAEWAREHLGLEFSRLRTDGYIVEGLRSAINSAIRRGQVRCHDATRISRADPGSDRQQSLAFEGHERDAVRTARRA